MMIAHSDSGYLVTRDLLGLDCTKELDLDLHVPLGFERRLDLKSGKLYLQRFKSSKLRDLNQPQLTLLDDTNLDLKLDSLSSSSSSSSSSPPYQSVCTLGKVRSALERIEKETNKKRSASMSESCLSLASNSSSSIKETKNIDDDNNNDDGSSESYAAGCPNCLLYVLISRSKPKCPRCKMIVPSPTLMKKPRIDLNIMI